MGAWSHVFALAYDPFLWWSERTCMRRIRAEQLAAAHGDVVELGAGTGLNLPHYRPHVRRLALVEPDPLLHPRLRRRLEAASVTGEVVPAGAESLPFSDDSFDVAVSTLVLCTVADPAGALREVARVLRPGGVLLFVEHVAAEEGSTLRRWQGRFRRPWQEFACGCRTDSETLDAIETSPLELTHVTQDRWRRMPAIVQPLVVGAATVPVG